MMVESLEPRRMLVHVKSFVLVEAQTGRELGPLVNGATIDLSAVGTRDLSIRAYPSKGTQSVRFTLSGKTHVENRSPYTLAGEGDGGRYNPWSAKAGAHKLTATAYTKDHAKGSSGKTTLRFRVVDGAAIPASPQPQLALTPAAAPGPWTMTFADEFNDRSVGTWRSNLWWAPDGEAGENVGDERVSRSNVSVSGGNLNLTATRSGDTYSSGLVTSLGVHEFQYGFIEARIDLPAGVGFWPAFWLLPANKDDGQGEIDIMEWVGDDVRQLHASYHVDGREDDVESDDVGFDLSEGFHTFGVDWSKETITWYVDGKQFHQTPNFTHTPMYAILNLAVGGEWPGEPAKATKFPSSMKVDYIRVWDAAKK